MIASGPSVITIGSFDGVHVGHRGLLRAARRLAADYAAREGATPGVVALAFDPHPASVLRPGSEPGRLTTFERRARLLQENGADRVVRLEPTPRLLAMSAAAFVDWLVEQFRPIAIVEGADFRFGKGRTGDVAGLRAMGRARDHDRRFAVHVVDGLEVALADQSVVGASSTMARWLIERGRVSDAARVLGAGYVVEGEVVRGDRRGRTLGYPTANVAPESMLPADGVYAGVARVLGQAESRVGPFVAAVSVGTKPQFNQGSSVRTLEAHLLDAGREAQGAAIAGLAEYGWRIGIEFVAFLREQARFDGVQALVDQIERDCARAREAVGRLGTLPEPALVVGGTGGHPGKEAWHGGER